MFQDIAPHRFDNRFYKDAVHPEDVALCYQGGHILLQPQPDGEFALPRACHLPQKEAMEAIYLFSIDNTRYFGFWQTFRLAEAPGLRWQSTQVLRQAKDKVMLFAGMEGWHLYRWFRANRFCGHCGGERIRLHYLQHGIDCGADPDHTPVKKGGICLHCLAGRIFLRGIDSDECLRLYKWRFSEAGGCYAPFAVCRICLSEY